MRRQVLGEANVDTASSMALLGRIAERRHDFRNAEWLYRQALGTDTAVLDRGHPRRAELLESLGGLLLEQGKPSEAEPLLREALAIRQSKTPEHWATPATASLLGACLMAQQRYLEAGPLLATSAARLEEWRSVRPREAAKAQANLRMWRARPGVAEP
jgi:Tfp pilus assembly protein PilF